MHRCLRCHAAGTGSLQERRRPGFILSCKPQFLPSSCMLHTLLKQSMPRYACSNDESMLAAAINLLKYTVVSSCAAPSLLARHKPARLQDRQPGPLWQSVLQTLPLLHSVAVQGSK